MTSTPDSSIHVALAFDDQFWAPAFTVMRSVAQHTRRRADLRFHLFHLALPDAHRADLMRIEEEFGATLVWYDLTASPKFRAFVEHLPRNERLPEIIYARMMLDRLVDPSIERLLYLDSDVLVRDAVELLYDIDMQEFPIAAVRDAWGAFLTFGRDLADRSVFDTADPYFNSGVMLIDVRRWREAGVIEQVERISADHGARRLYFDQDFLNLIFRNDWLQLSFRWNLMNARTPHEALHPGIVHYTGPSKPWPLLAPVAFRRLYRNTMTNELFYRYMRYRWKRYWMGKLKRLTGRR